jgi:hypothetical protein
MMPSAKARTGTEKMLAVRSSALTPHLLFSPG